MNSLKVVKGNGFFKKGDILEYNDTLGGYKLDEETENSFRSAIIDVNTAEEYVNDGTMIVLEDEVDYRIETVKEFLDTKIKEYKNDLQETQEKFEKGEMQPCVKVESETVLYNLIKLATAIKDKLENE